MKCGICKREAKDKYCEPHGRAYRNISKKFDVWRSALNLSWEEYLNEIVKNPYTGSWSREVAKHLINKLVAGDYESN